MTDQTIDEETADDIGDDVAAIEDPEGSKTYAYIWLSALFLTAVGGLVAGVYFGYIDPSLVLAGTVDIGWVIEYTLAGLGAIFVLLTFWAVARIAGMGFIGGIVGVVARIAHNYELPNAGDGNDEADGGDQEGQ